MFQVRSTSFGGCSSTHRKLFVGGLCHDTTDKSLRAYFEQFGVVASAEVLRDHQTLNSRGFGFVTFLDDSVAVEVINGTFQRAHVIDGKQVEVKVAVPRDSKNKDSDFKIAPMTTGSVTKGPFPFNERFGGQDMFPGLATAYAHKDRSATSSFSSTSLYSGAILSRASSLPTMPLERHSSLIGTPRSSVSELRPHLESLSRLPSFTLANKLFVGGLLYMTGHESLRRYFENFGEIESAEVIYNRDTKKSRGFGFVIFKRRDALESALQFQKYQPMLIDGKQVEIKLCKPREECQLEELQAMKRSSCATAPAMRKFDPLECLQEELIDDDFGLFDDIPNFGATYSLDRYESMKMEDVLSKPFGKQTVSTYFDMSFEEKNDMLNHQHDLPSFLLGQN